MKEELKIIVEKLVVCKRYVTAVNIIGHSECEAVINAGCIYKLMKLAGTEESIGVETFDDYAVQKIIGWFQQQEDIDLELRSDIEFIYLPMLDDYSEVRPRALNTKAYVNRMIKGKDGVVNKDFVQEKNPKMPWTTSFP